MSNPSAFRFRRKIFHLRRINRRLIALSILLGLLLLSSILIFAYFYHSKSVIVLPRVTKIYSANSLTYHQRYIQQKTIALFISCNNGRLNDYECEKMSVDIMDAALMFNLHPYKIAALIKIESNFNKDAVSGAQCVGLMQLNHRVHLNNFRHNFKSINSLSDLKQPRNNIMAGTWLFKMMCNASDGSVSGALNKYLGTSSYSYRLKFFDNLDVLEDIERSIRKEWRY